MLALRGAAPAAWPVARGVRSGRRGPAPRIAPRLVVRKLGQRERGAGSSCAGGLPFWGRPLWWGRGAVPPASTRLEDVAVTVSPIRAEDPPPEAHPGRGRLISTRSPPARRRALLERWPPPPTHIAGGAGDVGPPLSRAISHP